MSYDKYLAQVLWNDAKLEGEQETESAIFSCLRHGHIWERSENIDPDSMTCDQCGTKGKVVEV